MNNPDDGQDEYMVQLNSILIFSLSFIKQRVPVQQINDNNYYLMLYSVNINHTDSTGGRGIWRNVLPECIQFVSSVSLCQQEGKKFFWSW